MKRLRRAVSCVLLFNLCLLSISPTVAQTKPPYLDPSLPIDRRVEDLVSRMTLEEKISQMMNRAAGIERLGVPEYEWWNEALHGVARAGVATVFPQAIGMAATWNPELVHEVGDVVSTEARAKHHEAIRRGEHKRYQGLTFWSPNINIFRDPRWGRGQETFGEDPYLTSRIGVAYVKGLQGDDPKYLKVVSSVKHYAVHSGPEPERHGFDAKVNERDMRETYLPAFRATILEGKAEGLMCAYNSLNGEPACANKKLFDILRREWAFGGHVVSDCAAIEDIWKGHKFKPTEAEASAVAVKTGTDLTCGREYRSLVQAVKDGLINEAEIDVAVKRLMRTRFRLGMFDPPELVKYAQTPYTENDSPAHRALSLRTSRESIVLLKNDGDALPLKKELKTLAVIGPNADAPEVLLGNYNGTPSKSVTPLQGIREKVSAATRVLYAEGTQRTGKTGGDERALREDALAKAREADAVVMVMGINPSVEGEEMKVQLEGFRGGDRTDISLPKPQEELIKQVHALGKPVVLVLLGGSALAVNWADENVGAIVEAWYPGEEGGTALADVLFGDYNPAGRLPVTFYKSVEQLPPFDDYRMQGRTYRYFKGEPLYPFGHGLSYTTFKYDNLKLSAKSVRAGRGLTVSADVRNTGARAGEEVVQLYVTDTASAYPVAVRSLAGLTRIKLNPGETRRVSFTIDPRQLSVIDERGRRVVEPGEFTLSVGGKQPGFKGHADARTTAVVNGRFNVTGSVTEIPER